MLPTKYEDFTIEKTADTGKIVYISWADNGKKVVSKGEYVGTIPYITHHHPVMYVSELDRLFLGCECWWSFTPPDGAKDDVDVIDGVITRIFNFDDSVSSTRNEKKKSSPHNDNNTHMYI